MENEGLYHPSHYNAGNGDLIDHWLKTGMTDAIAGNIQWHVERAGKKPGEDPLVALRKAQVFLERWIEYLEAEQQKPSPGQAEKESVELDTDPFGLNRPPATLDSTIRNIVANDVDLQDYQAPEARPVANFRVTRDRAMEPGAD